MIDQLSDYATSRTKRGASAPARGLSAAGVAMIISIGLLGLAVRRT